MSTWRPVVVAAVAGLTAMGAHRMLVGAVRSPRWTRTNHAGDPVTLLEGPAFVIGAAVGAAPGGPAGVVAVLGSAGFGALDDLAGDGSSKGLRGHLGAAARGEVTTGLVKVAGLAASGLVAVGLLDRGRGDRTLLDTVVGGAVVAGSANLVNLLDLRPGRALKATILASGLLLRCPGRTPAAAAAGAALGVLPVDLAGAAMLGDTGANAAGALVGTALAQCGGRRTRVVALAALTAATLASERVSFTAVIESTPVLRWLDAWGRPAR